MNRSTPKPRGTNEDGIALLIALLFVVLLTVLVVEFVYETQVEATHSAGHQRSAEAMLTAKSAIAMGMSVLEADMFQQGGVQPGQSGNANVSAQGAGSGFGSGYDGLDEFWALGVQFQEINDAVMHCSIVDEFGKLNINALVNADTGQEQPILIEALRILFEARNLDVDPVDAILDWIDLDESPRAGGAESEYYQSLEVPYASRNGPMDSIEELLLIPGITPEVYFGDPLANQLPLSELLTVHGDRFGDINLNTSQWELLDALGIAIGQTGLADLVIAEREQQPFIFEEDYINRGVLPKDPLPLEVQADAEDENAENPNQLTVLRTVPATVESRCFRLRGHGIAGTSKVRIDAYIWRDPAAMDGLLRVIDWRVMQ